MLSEKWRNPLGKAVLVMWGSLNENAKGKIIAKSKEVKKVINLKLYMKPTRKQVHDGTQNKIRQHMTY